MSNPINSMLLQPSPLGEVFVSARGITGPASYTTGGVTISANTFAMLTLKYLASDMLSASGTYYARFKMPIGNGFPTATMVWFVTATGAEVANTTNLSAENIRVLAFGN